MFKMFLLILTTGFIAILPIANPAYSADPNAVIARINEIRNSNPDLYRKALQDYKDYINNLKQTDPQAYQVFEEQRAERIKNLTAKNPGFVVNAVQDYVGTISDYNKESLRQSLCSNLLILQTNNPQLYRELNSAFSNIPSLYFKQNPALNGIPSINDYLKRSIYYYPPIIQQPLNKSVQNNNSMNAPSALHKPTGAQNQPSALNQPFPYTPEQNGQAGANNLQKSDGNTDTPINPYLKPQKPGPGMPSKNNDGFPPGRKP